MRPRATHLVLPLYALAAVVFTWPLVRALGHAVPVTGVLHDARLQAYLLGWDWHALATHAGHVFDAPIFHPERNTLTYMDHLLGEAALGAPVYALTSSVAPAYGFLVLFAFTASAWAAYRLARACGASRPGAWLGGFAYSFGAFHFAQLDQLNLLHMEAIPLALWFALRGLARGRWRDWLGLAACALLQLALGWYDTFYLAFALVLLLAYALVCARPALRRVAWARAAVALALFAALATPLVRPYLAERRALPEFRRTLSEMEPQSAGVAAYVRVNRGAVAARWMPTDSTDKAYWPGAVTLLCAALGARALLRRRRPHAAGGGGADLAPFFVWLAVGGFVFSLGPYLHGVGHRNLGVPLPYLVLYKFVPGFASMRAPGRMAVLTLLGLAVLAALGFDAGRRALAAHRGALLARAFAAAALLLAVLEPWQDPVALAELPTARTLPPVYVWLAMQPRPTPVLELPAPADPMNESERDILRQYYALFHGQPRLDGASGFVSNRYRDFRARLRDFPTAAGLDTAQALGARLLIVHWGDWAPDERAARQAALAAFPGVELMATFGTDAVYRFAAPTAR